MSTKKRHLYDMAWVNLLRLCKEKGRAVTAGEFAHTMGIARSTAVRWLRDMLAEGAIETVVGVSKNWQTQTSYIPIGQGTDWQFDVKGVPPRTCPVCGNALTEERWQEERGYGALYRHTEWWCDICGELVFSHVQDMQND